MATSADSRRLRSAVALGLVTAGALVIIVGGLADSVSAPGTRWRIDRPLIVAAGGALLALGAVGIFLPLRLGVALLAASWTTIVATGIGYREPRAGEVVFGAEQIWSWVSGAGGGQLKKFESRNEWLDNFTTAHERYGQAGLPGASAQHVKHAFDVTYHLDADGYRVMPQPARPEYQLALVGCSYAFGHGVEDDETFPALLATQAWRQCRVRNHSLPGWGTVQACLQVEDLLASPDPPQCIAYAWITHHLHRNYLRRSWHGRMFRKFPLYTVVDDDAVFQGLLERNEATWPDGPEIDAAEREVTLHLIESMRRQCELAGATFVFLSLMHTYQDDVWPLIAADPRYHVVDVSNASHDFLPEDRHPTRRWHQAVASAIASDRRWAEWTGRPELHRPEAIGAPPASWALSVNYSQGARADLYDRTLTDAGGEADLRVDHLQLSQPLADWAIQLRHDGLTINAGESYTVRFRIRAERPRTIRYGVGQAHEPWGQLGLWKTLTVGRGWQLEEATFRATAGDERARLTFFLGDDTAAVEWKELTLTRRGVNLLAQPGGEAASPPAAP